MKPCGRPNRLRDGYPLLVFAVCQRSLVSLVQFQDLTSRRLKRDAPWVGALRAKEYSSKNRHKLKDKKSCPHFWNLQRPFPASGPITFWNCIRLLPEK